LKWKEYLDYETFRKPLERIGTQESSRVLDIGCGSGSAVDYLLSMGIDAVGLDKSGIYPRGIVGDALHLPFKKDSFDLIICSMLLPHLPQEKDVFDEIRRVLKDKGRIVLIVGNRLSFTLLSLRHSSSKFLQKRIPYSYYKVYSRSEVEDMLEKHGFEVQHLYSSVFAPQLVSNLPARLQDRILNGIFVLSNYLSKMPLIKGMGARIVATGRLSKVAQA